MTTMACRLATDTLLLLSIILACARPAEAEDQRSGDLSVDDVAFLVCVPAEREATKAHTDTNEVRHDAEQRVFQLLDRLEGYRPKPRWWPFGSHPRWLWPSGRQPVTAGELFDAIIREPEVGPNIVTRVAQKVGGHLVNRCAEPGAVHKGWADVSRLIEAFAHLTGSFGPAVFDPRLGVEQAVRDVTAARVHSQLTQMRSRLDAGWSLVDGLVHGGDVALSGVSPGKDQPHLPRGVRKRVAALVANAQKHHALASEARRLAKTARLGVVTIPVQGLGPIQRQLSGHGRTPGAHIPATTALALLKESQMLLKHTARHNQPVRRMRLGRRATSDDVQPRAVPRGAPHSYP